MTAFTHFLQGDETGLDNLNKALQKQTNRRTRAASEDAALMFHSVTCIIQSQTQKD